MDDRPIPAPSNIDNPKALFHEINERHENIKRWIPHSDVPRNAIVIREMLDRNIKVMQELRGVVDAIVKSEEEFLQTLDIPLDNGEEKEGGKKWSPFF